MAHRIDSVGCTTDNKFTSGNPREGQPATIVTPDWLNAVQEEIAGVIEGQGITLNKQDNTQLATAVTKVVNDKFQLIDSKFPVLSAQDVGKLISVNASGNGFSLFEPTPLLGFVSGMYTYRGGSNSVIVKPGVIEYNGILRYLNHAITVSREGLFGNDWYYVYLKNIPDNHISLGSADFYLSYSDPSYNYSRAGYYTDSGSDYRAFACFHTDSSGNIENFYVRDNHFELRPAIRILNDATPGTSRTLVNACVPPAFALVYADFTFYLVHNNTKILRLAMGNNTTTTCYYVGAARSGTTGYKEVRGDTHLLTNNGQIAYFAYSYENPNNFTNCEIYMSGFALPRSFASI